MLTDMLFSPSFSLLVITFYFIFIIYLFIFIENWRESNGLKDVMNRKVNPWLFSSSLQLSASKWAQKL